MEERFLLIIDKPFKQERLLVKVQILMEVEVLQKEFICNTLPTVDQLGQHLIIYFQEMTIKIALVAIILEQVDMLNLGEILSFLFLQLQPQQIRCLGYINK